MSFTYWPYDEVSIDATGEELNIMTPWLKASTSLIAFNKESVDRLSAKLGHKTLSAEDLPWVSDFFSHFEQFPLAYILPTNKNGGLDLHGIKDSRLENMSFQELLLLTCPDIKLDGLLKTRSFEWDQQSALDFASFNDQIHPESLFSIARRYHILELITNDQGQEVFKDMSELKSEQYKNQVARIVRQNHYVTEHCQEALQPALDIAQSAAPLIKDFMAAERGHDKILKKALFHLGKAPEDVPVSAETCALMSTLKYLAGRNFLAFAMAVDAFERNNYEESDPIAKLLNEGGFSKAAEFINLHMKINDNGGHENVAIGFLESMALVDRAYALEALKLMEILSVLMTTISQSVVDQSRITLP